MTNNIEKLYKLVGVEKRNYCGVCINDCTYCPYEFDEPRYPLFTAAKQLELIKYLANKGMFLGKTKENNFSISYYDSPISYIGNDFSETLAMFVVSQHLTDEQKAEIKRILR